MTSILPCKHLQNKTWGEKGGGGVVLVMHFTPLKYRFNDYFVASLSWCKGRREQSYYFPDVKESHDRVKTHA